MEYQAVRHFYRCLSCLEVFAVDGPELKPVYVAQVNHVGKPSAYVRARCDCGGLIDHMGRVGSSTANVLVKDEERCPCDSRCTNAKGPNCECVCHGKNHGTQALIKVEVVVGKVPQVAPKRPLAERKVVVEEARAAFAAAFARIDAKTGGAASKARGGGFVADKAVWWEQKCLRDALKKAANLKTHKGRLAAMAKVAAPEGVPA